MTTVRVVKRSVLARELRDVEPKLVAGLIAALSSAQVLALVVGYLTGSGNVLLTELAALVPTFAFLAVGYLKASTHKGDLLAKVAADGPADLGRVTAEAAAVHLIPAGAADAFAAAVDVGSQIVDVPTPIHQ